MFFSLMSQSVGIGASLFIPDATAILEVQSTEKGILIPRLTQAQRDAISNPAHSLMIFNTSTYCFEFYNQPTNSWITISCGCDQMVSAPVAIAATNVTSGSFQANWNTTVAAAGYYLDVATDASFVNFVPGYYNVNVGNVTSFIVSGLSSYTTYYYRVRAYNNCGISSNSNVIEVTTDVIRTPYCNAGGISLRWMLQPVNLGIMIAGTSNQNNDTQIEKYCYNNWEANCALYGGLYQWAEALQAPFLANSSSYTGTWATCDPCGNNGRQGVCPTGFHVPSDLEFSRYEWCVETNLQPTGSTSLSTFQNNTYERGSTNQAGPGYKMKSALDWNGGNASGFTGLPGGWRLSGGGFQNALTTGGGNANDMWTTREYNNNEAWYHYLFQNYQGAWRYYHSKLAGMTVRCMAND